MPARLGLVAFVLALVEGGAGTSRDDPRIDSTGVLPPWVHSLLLNLLGYSTVLVPGYALFRYLRHTGILDKPGGGWWRRVLVAVYGSGEDSGGGAPGGDLPLVGGPPPPRPRPSPRQETLHLLLCFTGLQGSYLTWGVLQEKVMTQAYGEPGAATGRGSDSQFLVFVNRGRALGRSSAYLLVGAARGTSSRPRPRTTAPLYLFSFSSLSNIMSSWCQYEALKYISFPTQVLAKASKVIPVMAMGRLVSGKSYEAYEYATAALISAAMFTFMISTAHQPDHGPRVTTLSGCLLLVGYLCLDSFTSSWQDSLFTRHRVSPVQMMWGVNLFSCLLTATSLLQQGSFGASLAFVSQYPRFGVDCVLLSVASGAGQLFIFETISRFGAVVFTVMMTVRQALAVIISCFLYGHSLPAPAALASAVVLAAVLLRLWCRQRRLLRPPATPSKV